MRSVWKVYEESRKGVAYGKEIMVKILVEDVGLAKALYQLSLVSIK
jgi:hypothetical protein